MNGIFKPYFGLFLILFLTAYSCKKQETTPFLEVTITTPEESEIFTIPDTIWVRFSIESEKSIQSLRLSIDNEDLIPLSNKVYLESVDNTLSFEVPLVVEEIPGMDSMKAYLNLLINDGVQEKHWFREISLISKPLSFRGMVIITEDNLVNSQAYFYDSKGMEIAHMLWAGITSNALFISESDLMIVTTQTPEYMLAIRFVDQEYAWMKQAPLPNPEFTSMDYDTPFLYYGLGAGRVVSVNTSTGLQHNETEVFNNYYPTAIAVNSDKLVFTQESRTGQSGRITTCYKSTGALQQHYLTDFRAVFADESEQNEDIIFIGNNISMGSLLIFSPKENEIINSFDFNFGPILNAVPIDGGNYLLLTSQALYLFHFGSGQTQQLYSSINEISSFTYDQKASIVYLVIEKEVFIYAYPQFTLNKKLIYPDQVKTVCLRYLR